MKDKMRTSKKTMALLAAAILLLAGSGIMGAKASLTVSEDYTAAFYLNHLQVHLMENGKDVCGGVNTLDGATKVTGQLATKLGYQNSDKGEVLGEAIPGKVYDEEIAAKNGQDIPQYVRMTVRKYWVKTDEAGKVKKNDLGEPVKMTGLSPDQIRLTYGADDPKKKASNEYNTGAWVINSEETTSESATYYYRTELPANTQSQPLFDRVCIDKSVADGVLTEESKEGEKTIYKYVYEYDGCAFYIEADVQAIQTHNAEDAIHSQWGVYNVTAGDGKLTVK